MLSCFESSPLLVLGWRFGDLFCRIFAVSPEGAGRDDAWSRRRKRRGYTWSTLSSTFSESLLVDFFQFCSHGGQGSPDYSEYEYEPEYELQGEDKFDADAETLAQWRLEKLLANDRWQFGKYGSQNVGNWIGELAHLSLSLSLSVVGGTFDGLMALLLYCIFFLGGRAHARALWAVSAEQHKKSSKTGTFQRLNVHVHT